MNALQRLQETQETMQGVAARLRIDIAGLKVTELAGVIATELVKLHDELITARSSLADMERQRDEAKRMLSTEGVAMAEALRRVKAIAETRGIQVGDYWNDIPLAVVDLVGMLDVALSRVKALELETADTAPVEKADPCRDILTPGIDGCSACLDRLQALTVRAEKAERELARVSHDLAHAQQVEIPAYLEERNAAQAELARFQRADVGERVREIEGLHATAVEASAIKHRPGLVNVANDRHRHRAELLSIVRQQAAEIERLHKNLTAVGAILGRGWEETHEQAALGVAMHGVFSRSAARIWKRAAKKLYAETGRNAEQWVRDQVRIADMQRCRLATENCLTESRAECNRLHAHLSAIRERVEGIPTYGFTDPGRVALVVRSEVLSALGVVKDSLTTERKPVCSHCNDTHRIGIRWCSRCPRPCKEKCHDGNGYCRQTPCPCDCHKVASEAKS